MVLLGSDGIYDTHDSCMVFGRWKGVYLVGFLDTDCWLCIVQLYR